jgi:hypothetical protein
MFSHSATVFWKLEDLGFQLSKHLRHLLFLDLVAPTIAQRYIRGPARILFIHLGETTSSHRWATNKKWTSTSQLEVLRGKSTRNVAFHRKINEKFGERPFSPASNSGSQSSETQVASRSPMKTNITFRMKWGIKTCVIWNDMEWTGESRDFIVMIFHHIFLQHGGQEPQNHPLPASNGSRSRRQPG